MISAMNTAVQRPRLKRNRPTISARPSRSGSLLKRSTQPTVARARQGTPAAPPSPSAGFAPDPYVDYGRSLTPQGGIAIIYKDHDQRFRHALRRLAFFSIPTGTEAWLLRHQLPLHHAWITLALFVAVAVINWLIVMRPVEIYRLIEIRPDCMIIDGADIFWLRHMEGRPAFRPDSAGNQMLCGVYGTRFVEYLTVRRFDELDRAPEVFAGHLQDAMRQLWNGPH